MPLVLDDPIPVNKVVNLQCDQFHNGKRHVLTLSVVVAYCLLVSGRGCKVGLQFEQRCPATAKTIAELLK